MPSNEIVLLACGDIGPVHEPVGPLSSLVSPTLANGDIRFAQAERVYSERGALQVTGVERSRLQPHMASVFTDCGFNVVSVAGNHALDWGPDAFVDTINLLKGLCSSQAELATFRQTTMVSLGRKKELRSDPAKQYGSRSPLKGARRSDQLTYLTKI